MGHPNDLARLGPFRASWQAPPLLARLGHEQGRGRMVSPEASLLGARLDEHHPPETNGRMAVCRRCGAQTQGPQGQHHLPSDRLLQRSGEWLQAQSRLHDIDQARRSLNR